MDNKTILVGLKFVILDTQHRMVSVAVKNVMYVTTQA
jgi:hypothetical protein